MGYMRDVNGRRLDSIAIPSLTEFQALRRRDLPGLGALPTLMASPPATAVNTTSQIASSLLTPPDTGSFAYSGGAVSRGTTYPDYLGVASSKMYGITTGSPYAIDFLLDTADATGRFEVLFKRNGVGCRVLVQNRAGHWEYVTQAPTFKAGGGDLAYGLVTLGAAGIYRLRLECDAGFVFCGIQAAPTDGITATLPPRRRIIVIGDSYTEPTISDVSGTEHSWDGYVQLLSYVLGADCISAGSGGTGYLQPNNAADPPRPKLGTRLSEITPYVSGAEVWVANGVNDYGNFTAAQIGAEALADFQALLTAGAAKLVAIGPYWPRSVTTAAENLLLTRDAIKASATTVGATFLDPLSLPVQAPAAATTLHASAAATANTISTVAALGSIADQDWWVQIGTGTTAEVRLVGAQSGTGPYQYGFGATARGGILTFSHSAGEPVIPVGPSMISGAGRQGSTTGEGTGDRYTGTDATHPTVLGMRNIAAVLLSLYSLTLQP